MWCHMMRLTEDDMSNMKKIHELHIGCKHIYNFYNLIDFPDEAINPDLVKVAEKEFEEGIQYV